MQVHCARRPPVAMTAAATGGRLNAGVAGVTGDAVIGRDVMVTIPGAGISPPEGRVVTAFTVSDRIKGGVTVRTAEALTGQNHIVVLLLGGPGWPAVRGVTALAIIDDRQIGVTALAEQIRVGCQLVMVRLPRCRRVTADTVSGAVTGNRAMTGGAIDVLAGANHIVVLVQSAAGAAGIHPESRIMTGKTVGFGDQGGVADRAIDILLDADDIVMLFLRRTFSPEGIVVTLLTTGDVGGSTVTGAAAHAELDHLVVAWPGIAAGVTIVTAAVESDAGVTRATIKILLYPDDIVVLFLRRTFGPEIGVVTDRTLRHIRRIGMAG